jgi:hypothetical protein
MIVQRAVKSKAYYELALHNGVLRIEPKG